MTCDFQLHWDDLISRLHQKQQRQSAHTVFCCTDHDCTLVDLCWTTLRMLTLDWQSTSQRILCRADIDCQGRNAAFPLVLESLAIFAPSSHCISTGPQG